MTARDKVIALRKEHPEWMLRQVGDGVGVTRERVRQILKEEGIPKKKIYSKNWGGS